MDECLAHDPRTKQQIKDILYSYLYSPIETEFKKKIERIILQNTSLQKASHPSFVYKGDYYSQDNSKPPRKMNKLHPSLETAMEDLLKEQKKLNTKELPYVMSFINQVLNSTNTLHDYLKVLPESIHEPIQNLIQSHPCRGKSLTDTTIRHMQDVNQNAIQMIKERLALNLLI